MQVISVDELVKYQGENVIVDSFEAVPMSVIDEIKADIELARYGLVNDGLDVALKIIEKHTGGTK